MASGVKDKGYFFLYFIEFDREILFFFSHTQLNKTDVLKIFWEILFLFTFKSGRRERQWKRAKLKKY